MLKLNRKLWSTFALTFSLVITSSIHAQGVPTAAEKAAEEALALKIKAEEDKRDEAILKKYFGAGIMANVDLGGKGSKRVKTAHVVGGLVRVDEESTSRLGFVLEAHKFISDKPTGRTFDKNYVHGPFLALSMGSEGAIDTGIIGYMWGFRQSQSTQTLNIGLGASITPKAQVLGDGITANTKLPEGETEVRYKNITKVGLAIIVSFGF